MPYLEKLEPEALVAASGTSCRHQIHDGIARTARTARTAQHPARILRDAMK